MGQLGPDLEHTLPVTSALAHLITVYGLDGSIGQTLKGWAELKTLDPTQVGQQRRRLIDH